VQLYSLDYVAGDTIRVSIDFRDKEDKYSVTINLYQILKFTMENTSKIETLVSTATLPATSNQNNLICLKSSNDLPPSFNFSKMMSLSYKLQITLQRASSTLETLFPYSLFNRSTRPLPLPKFIEYEEHEDALPLYDSTKLPRYN
ncbi:hypothetical protein K501DRAFT_161132, partial [Backusella circina FSU 941]